MQYSVKTFYYAHHIYKSSSEVIIIFNLYQIKIMN